jgi:hypothetical protein
VLAGVACRVSLGDDKIYSCADKGDCGGDGFVCAAPPGGAGKCCKPSGPEICNGLDDDCNGKVDDGLPSEICNGADDNCDGKIDEGFNLLTDGNNCGSCGHACNDDSFCSTGTCKIRGETNCVDGVDNDLDGKIDCADPDCNLVRCGSGCECRAGKKAEGNCSNDGDDDADGKIDCADEDCAGAGCGDGGCICSALKKSESNCADTRDNDSDTQVDCADSDCAGQLCKPAPATFRCSGTTCDCNGGTVVNEMGPLLCRDHLDNDCDGLVDCAEASCNNLSCASDGGVSCRCLFGVRTETDCADRKDNDDDGTTDCGDSLPDGGGDCPINTACTFLNSGGMVKPGTCAADHTCK